MKNGKKKLNVGTIAVVNHDAKKTIGVKTIFVIIETKNCTKHKTKTILIK